MRLSTRQPDLFATPQADLFDREAQPSAEEQAEQMQRIVRPRLETLMATIKAASTMPWTIYDAKTNAILFHQMANWLPPAERESLRAAFRGEYERLDALPYAYPFADTAEAQA